MVLKEWAKATWSQPVGPGHVDAGVPSTGSRRETSGKHHQRAWPPAGEAHHQEPRTATWRCALTMGCGRLRYMDTLLRPCIAYRIRIRYGYASDTPSIRILAVSDFFLFSQLLDTDLDTYLPCRYAQPYLILCPRRPQSHARASCRIPVPRSVTPHCRSLAAGD